MRQDRLTPEVSGPFFLEGQDFLKQLRAHVIYTVPVALALPPGVNLSAILPSSFSLSVVKTHEESGRPSKKGIDALVDAVSRRIDIDAVFSKPSVVRTLAEKSGGRVRDLMRLVGDAGVIARVEGKERIDPASAKKAVLRLRLEFAKILIPSRVYYPLLAQVHLTKNDPADASREHFRDLLFNGSVLAYNGDEVWYDVHPVIEDIAAFQKALSHAQAAAQAEPEPEEHAEEAGG